MKFSVIIPSFNRASLVMRAIQSVLKQSYQDFELIVVDDGSTDNTQELISHLPLRYFKTENRGVSHARNYGFKKAKGEWLCFLDSDDEWSPHKLDFYQRTMAKQPKVKFFHSDEIWIRDGVRVNPHQKHRKNRQDLFEASFDLCLISAGTVCIERELYKSLNGFREDYPCCEDYDLWLRVQAHHPIHFIDEALTIKYAGHIDQLSKQYKAMDYWRVKTLVDLISTSKLSDKQRNSLLKVMKRKASILIKGFRKHGHENKADLIEKLVAPYAF